MNDLSLAETKAGMRAELRLRRKQLNNADREVVNREINETVTSFAREAEVSALAAYWAFDGEPDILPALGELSSAGATVAMPVLEDSPEPSLTLYRWQPGMEMRENRYGIPEPADESLLEIRALDLVLVPLVAWDRRGGRLGMGKGYYDRLLEPLRDLDTPLRMGLAYGLQEVTAVPANELDIPMHGVICEHGWTLFDNKE